jgi:hypothetical protein
MSSGTRTRFGFAGAGEEPPERRAPTVLGHLAHQEGASPAPDPAPAEPPLAEPPVAELPVAGILGPTGKSELPAVAANFGRWNSEGQLEPHQEAPRAPALADPDRAPTEELSAADDMLELPRERLSRPMLVVVGVAVLCFVVAALVTRLGGRRVAPGPAPEVTPASVEPVLAPMAGPPVPPPPATTDSPRPAPAARATDDSPPNPTRAPGLRRTRPRPARVADPDNVLPPRFLR